MNSKIASIPDLDVYAKTYLSKHLYEHLNGFSQDGITKRENAGDFEYIRLKLRGMFNMKNFKGIETTILGH